MRRTADHYPADILFATSRCSLTDLEYADDVVIFAKSTTKPQHDVNLVSKLAAAYGYVYALTSNENQGGRTTDRTRRRVLQPGLKNNGNYERDVQQRCAKPTFAFNSLTKCVWSTPITNEVKLPMYLSANSLYHDVRIGDLGSTVYGDGEA
ncbi:hypothetical protein RB195_019280 [Necator americanus]|uniref:Reverse transcriptase domain-containing protein n=1 Tax=Necator americanus TaxID=51031 RepID=A0ABR1CDH3_NECAM